MRITRATGMLLAAVAVAGMGVLPAYAYIQGDGKGKKPEADCLIGLEGYGPGDISGYGKKQKDAIQCTDCDPACDLDGQSEANGSCTFQVGVRVNDEGVSGCTPAALKTVKVKAKTKGVKLSSKAGDFGTIPLDGSPMSSSLAEFRVLTKKHNTKPGTGKMSLLAKKLEKPKLADKDKFLFVCNPRPEGEACPGATTTTTTIMSSTTTTTLSMPVCGNGVLEGSEECDDGNPDPTDGCTNACTLCGDGIVTAPEECDEGPGSCTAPPVNVGNTCYNNLQCGTDPGVSLDGVCEGGNQDSATCAPNCTVPGCGNGLVELGETCDDGNTDDGDSCPSNCVIESCEAVPASDFTVDVTFAGSDEVAALQLYIDYPEGLVVIPGSGGTLPDGIITDLPGFAFGQSNDLDYALRQSIVDTAAFPQGLAFRIHFETCNGATPPTAQDFSCMVEVAGNANSEEIQGVTCAVAPTP